jgi:predicted ATPase
VGPSTGLFDLSGQRLVTPPIRGRADELKTIGASVDAMAHGRGGLLVIEGPPGIGKSRLLTEVMALADKRGVRTLFGEAFEYQQTVPKRNQDTALRPNLRSPHNNATRASGC